MKTTTNMVYKNEELALQERAKDLGNALLFFGFGPRSLRKKEKFAAKYNLIDELKNYLQFKEKRNDIHYF